MPTPSLFDAARLDAILDRIRQLKPSATAQWGKMNVAQMLAHCQVTMRVATGETVLKRTFIGLLFGRLARKALTRDKTWGKNMPTHESFKIHDTRDFTNERDGLLARVNRLGRDGPSSFATQPHPFFGQLTETEWNALTWRHIDHHLRQFGA